MTVSRGYIGFMRERSVPQRIQQLVIRDYCQRNGLEFLLSATEYENSTIILRSIKEDVIVFYSLFLLSDIAMLEELMAQKKRLHFAAENLICDPSIASSVDNVKNILKVMAICENIAPYQGELMKQIRDLS